MVYVPVVKTSLPCGRSSTVAGGERSRKLKGGTLPIQSRIEVATTFSFAEQHSRLKPLHPGKDREISRMIGGLWNKFKDSEITVYKDQAMRDKERYSAEMEDYRERVRTGQVIRDAVPLQQCLSELQVNMEELPLSPAIQFVVEGSSDRRDGDLWQKHPLEQISQEGKLVISSPEIPRS